MVCLKVQNMVDLGACSMYTWQECVFLLLLDGVLCKCQLDQESTCSINYLVLLIILKGTWQSPSIIVDFSISPFIAISFNFMEFATLLFRCIAAKSLQSCPTLCDPIDGTHQAPPSLGFSREEHWSGLPFPSPMHESEKWKWSCSVVSDPQRPYGLQPTRLLHPWDFPGKSTGVGCHCLLRLLSRVPYKC